MIYTILKQYWEEGSRPGRMKINTTFNMSVIDVKDEAEALDIFQRRVAHAIRISYHQSRFHSAQLFEGDVSDLANPFLVDVSEQVGKFQLNRRKHWELENDEVVQEHRRFTLGSERPAFWAGLSRSQQHAVALADRVSPELADTIARQFQLSSLPI